MSTNCECYKKLRLAAVMAAAGGYNVGGYYGSGGYNVGGYAIVVCSALHKQFVLGVWGKSQLCLHYI